MNSIESIAMMLEPDNEIERIRIKLRLQELTTEVHLYRMLHPNTKLSYEKILKRVKRSIAWRIIRNYLFRPFIKLKYAFVMLRTYMEQLR